MFRARREGAAGFERTVVVKKILGSHNEDPQFVDMFINEAKISSQLTHPNIVQVYELGEEGNEFFIVMEYVKGKDLLRLLRALAQNKPESPAVPPLVAAYIAREAVRGLAHAHEHTDEGGTPRPIVHRDVSPQNIMLSYDGQVKIVDFGIAKALDTMKEETRTGALKGKFAYMAPEQVGGNSPGPQSDLFAAGVVLHEMLTGRRLFKGGNDYETLQKVQTMPVPLPSTVSKAVSAELDAIVMQALDRDRKVRYGRAAHMARDLDVFLQSHRFAVEDMAEYMSEIFPLAEREDVPEGPMTSSYSIQKAVQEPTMPSQPRAIAGTPSAVRAERVKAEHAEHAATARNKRIALYGGAAFIGIAVAAIVVVPIARKHPPATDKDEHAVVEPIVRPAEADKPLGSDRPVDWPLDAPAPGDVRVISEPVGAQIYAGPKLVGTAPVTLHLGKAGNEPVTLVHTGYEDLQLHGAVGRRPVADVAHAEAPSWRRDALAHKTPATPPTAKDKGPHKAKVDTFDDGDKAPHVPKVQPIDD